MAHVKGDPTQGHVEGDKIWDKESNRLYILKNINGKLVWDVPRLERKDGFFGVLGSVFHDDTEGPTIRSGSRVINQTGEINQREKIRHDKFMQIVARGYTIRNGEVYKSDGSKLVGPLNKRAFYSTSYDSDTAKLLQILSEEQATIRKSNRKDGQYLVNYNKSKRYFKSLESLSKTYNIPMNVLLGLNIEEDLGTQLNAAGYTNHRISQTLHEHGGNYQLLGFGNAHYLPDQTLANGSVVPGDTYRRQNIPLPNLKKILYGFHSYNKDVLTYQENNPESLNVQNHLKIKPIKKEKFLNMLGTLEDINKLNKEEEEEEPIQINDIIGDVY